MCSLQALPSLDSLEQQWCVVYCYQHYSDKKLCKGSCKHEQKFIYLEEGQTPVIRKPSVTAVEQQGRMLLSRRELNWESDVCVDWDQSTVSALRRRRPTWWWCGRLRQARLVHALLDVFEAFFFFFFFIFDDFYLHCEHVEEERWSSIRTVAVILDHKTKMEKKVTICWQFCFSHCVVFNQVNAEDITWLNKGK